MYTPHFCTIQNIYNSTTFSIQCTASYYEASCYFIIMRSTHLSSWSAIILIYYLQKGAEVHEYVVLMCWIGMKSMYQYTYTKHINYFIVCPTYTLCKAMKPIVHTMPAHQVQVVRMQNHWHMTDGTQQVPFTGPHVMF